MKKNQRPADMLLTRRRLEPSERRAQLLKHAISAFAEAGIERAAHADVAARAQVSTPTVFNYFPTRDALVDAVLSEVEKIAASLEDYLPKGQRFKPSELMRIMAKTISATCSHRPDLMRVALIWSAAFSPVRQRFLALEARQQHIFASALGPDTLNKSDLLILSSCAREYISMHFDGTTEEMRRDFVNRLCELMDSTQIPKP